MRARSIPISAVIPTRNRPELLAEALKSVVGQTLRVAETIVVDDGSTQDVASVAEFFGARVIRQDAGGPAAARNAGLRAASSPWVAFLDSDDSWYPRKLELQTAALALCPDADVVFSDYSIFSDDAVLCRSALTGSRYTVSSKHINDVRQAYALSKTRRIAPYTFLCAGADVRNAIVRYNCMLTSSLLVRRDSALQISGFDTSLRIAEDWDFLLRLLLHSSAIAIERRLVRYRMHSDNTSANFIEAASFVVSMVDKSRQNRAAYPPEMCAHWERRLPEYTIDAALAALREQRLDYARWFRLRGGHPRSLRALWRSTLFVLLQSGPGQKCAAAVRPPLRFLRWQLATPATNDPATSRDETELPQRGQVA